MGKELLVLRHAAKEGTDRGKEAQLTDTGRMEAKRLGEQIGSFSLVIATSRQRARDTAKLLSGTDPIIDDRAGFIDLSKEGFRVDEHPLRTEEVVFEDPRLNTVAQVSGLLLIVLIQEILQQLPENERALIVSHDIPMLAAERELTHRDKIGKSFGYLEGFRVNETLVPKRSDELQQ